MIGEEILTDAEQANSLNNFAPETFQFGEILGNLFVPVGFSEAS
jgi:hypothetical protein